MSIKQVRNKIMELIINGNNNNNINNVNHVSLERYLHRENNIEYNFLPFVDMKMNNKELKKYLPNPSPPLPNDNLTKIYVIGLSCLGLYMLNSLLNKK